VAHDTLVIVTARNEAERIAATVAALGKSLAGAPVLVADDCSSDATAEIAGQAGARVVRAPRALGKGGAATLAARQALREVARSPDGADADVIVLLCDGDLGESAARLGALVQAVASGEADIAVAQFTRRLGGGLGLAVAFARWAIRRRCGLRTEAPISGQRALQARVLADVLPFAAGFGMELGMTIDAVRAGYRVGEIELDLTHRATGRTPAGFIHRGHQLWDFARVYVARR
jgi:glycosyltransferase involved in cell wall biosynthesis